uniref:Jun-like transcription factor domain-containing protein n=1 Tax=Scylla olivacea TaxID=85551 RepID=A0A0N7ZAR2_SCYOL
MEASMYEDGSYNNYSRESVSQMKRRLTLDLTSRPSKRQRGTTTTTANFNPLLTSPDLNQLKLASPELERIIMQQSGAAILGGSAAAISAAPATTTTATTATTQQFFFQNHHSGGRGVRQGLRGQPRAITPPRLPAFHLQPAVHTARGPSGVIHPDTPRAAPPPADQGGAPDRP